MVESVSVCCAGETGLADTCDVKFCLNGSIYIVGSKSFRPDVQKPRQMENAVRDI